MRYATVEYTGGHTLVDNGVGDYDLVCPHFGVCGFAHMGVVAQIDRGNAGCMACGASIGGRCESSPEPYTVEACDEPVPYRITEAGKRALEGKE